MNSKSKRRFNTKKESLFLNYVTLFVLNATFFECNNFPKHIIEIESAYSILSALMSSIFFFFEFSFLYVALNRNTHFLSKDFYLIFEPTAKKAGFLYALQFLIIVCGFDAVRLAADFLLPKFSFFISDILVLLSWICFYLLLAKPNENIFKNSGYCIAFSAIVVCLMVPSLWADFILEQNEALLSLKYESGSVNLQNGIKNLNFAFEFKSFLLDSLIGITLFSLHSRHKKNLDSPNEATPASRFSSFCKVLAVVLTATLFILLEGFIAPGGNISELEIRGSDVDRYEFDGTFYAQTKIVTATRLKGWGKGESALVLTKNHIFHNGVSVLKYYSSDSQNSHHFTTTENSSVIVFEDEFDELIINETPVQIYKGSVICFVQNGKPIAIRSEDINSYEKNDILLDVCKKLLSDRNAAFFEYCNYYIDKYDPEFILPFAKRYENSDFTKEELKNLEENDIKVGFIVDIAKSMGQS